MEGMSGPPQKVNPDPSLERMVITVMMRKVDGCWLSTTGAVIARTPAGAP